MKESATYQAILAEGNIIGRQEGERLGRAQEARNLILLLGEKRYGKASDTVRRKLEAIPTPEALEVLAGRLLEVESWDELLA